MKRTLTAFVAFIVVFLALFSFISFNVSAESLYIRKIVSVVYDDSTSMKNKNKNKYANYAMQVFCSMLNSEDQLYITYMSGVEKDENYVPKKIDLSKSGIQKSIDTIRDNTDSINRTPYGAVTTAYNKLKSVQDDNPNTQYWLVVITDGAFAGSPDLNKEFNNYVQDKMPNGTNPQITFLGIGDVIAPDNNPEKGIYEYNAKDSTQIVATMAQMADRISGRTRLKNEDLTLNGKKLQISSDIPLLNIVVLIQEDDATITKAGYAAGDSIEISRAASVSVASVNGLSGHSYLIGDSKKIIGSGTYDIEFDSDVNRDNIVVLFEPALEVRMSVKINGKDVSNNQKIDDVRIGDKISVSCKIYEMGTDKEIPASAMPTGTEFEISVIENGNKVKEVTTSDMTLTSYTINDAATEIRASVVIKGFNPIEYSIGFKPEEQRKIVYTMSAEFGNGVKSVKFDDVAKNKDLTICFTVFADGDAITDPEEVKALNPTITVSPQGNGGKISYSNDGKIIFTPDTASATVSAADSFDVNVTCSIDDGVSASETYKVLLALYQVVPIKNDKTIKKTEFFDNQVSASFYITKDGVRLSKSDVEKGISVSLNEEYSDLKTKIEVAADGTITVTPYSEEEHSFNWICNYCYYWGLQGKDVVVTLNHSYGSAECTLDVVGESAGYIIGCVIAPLLLEILLVAAIIAYIIRYFTKARFARNGILYVGDIALEQTRTARYHVISLSAIPLEQFNKFKYLWHPFKELSISVSNIDITAEKGNLIVCNNAFPWYNVNIKPISKDIVINSPMDVVEQSNENGLKINEIRKDSVIENRDRGLLGADATTYYAVNIDEGEVRVFGGKNMKVIEKATVFCYSTD